MIHLSIEEPKIEKFFNSSKDEIMKALQSIVDNDISKSYYEYISIYHNDTCNISYEAKSKKI